MTVAPLIAMKSTKCESLEAVGKELDRRAHTYANDVDQSGRHIGYCCRADDAHPLPLDKAVERRMGELNTKRKIRDNAVRAMGFIVSSNDALDEKSAREFLDRSINWFGARYGYENLLAAQIHLDEGTPHAHIWVAPVIHDRETGFDRLCAKELGFDHRRNTVEQRRLSGAAASHDPQKFSGHHLKGDPIQGLGLVRQSTICFCQVFNI